MENGCDLKILGQSFQLALRAENKSPRTIETYLEAITLLDTWLREQSHSTLVGDIRREHINAFISSLLAKGKKRGTANNRFRSFKTFFRWSAEEEEIEHSPMAILKPPRVPETPVPVLSDEAIDKLEQHVWRALAQGATSKQVAALTGFTKRKVDGHRANSLRKLKAENVFEAIQQPRKLSPIHKPRTPARSVYHLQTQNRGAGQDIRPMPRFSLCISAMGCRWFPLLAASRHSHGLISPRKCT